MVANGYVRGALEYAAGAWLPAASTSHLELVDRELRAAARVVTGCTMSTPAHALMADTGLPTARTRRATLAARMLGTAASLPEGEPLRALAEETPTRHLKTTTGWRGPRPGGSRPAGPPHQLRGATPDHRPTVVCPRGSDLQPGCRT